MLATLGDGAPAVLDGVARLLEARRRCAELLPQAPLEDVLGVVARDGARAPSLRGAAAGGLLSLGTLQASSVVELVQAFARPEKLGDFLTGLFRTAREALRNKVLYSILAFAALVVGVAALFGSASIGNQMKFVKDFSLAAISLFGVVIAVTLGVSMLSKELGRRTILNILSKPVARWQFIVGKFAGLAATLAIVVAQEP